MKVITEACDSKLRREFERGRNYFFSGMSFETIDSLRNPGTPEHDAMQDGWCAGMDQRARFGNARLVTQQTAKARHDVKEIIGCTR